MRRLGMLCVVAALAAVGAGCDDDGEDVTPAPAADGAGEEDDGDIDESPANAIDDTWIVHPGGVGPIVVGQSADQVEELLGVGLELSAIEPGDPAQAECAVGELEGDPLAGLGFILARGEIRRVDMSEPTLATDEGIRVGDQESKVRTAYGDDLTESPHEYVDGLYLRAEGAEAGQAIVYETDGDEVVHIRAGLEPEVDYIEGCA